MDDTEAAQSISRWWFAYDEGDFAALTELLEPDAHFRCRTDTGTTSFEEFVRVELDGREAIMRWQTEHRLDSPYPLRHHVTNFHVTARADDVVRFRHYLAVTQVKDVLPAAVPGGVVEGALRWRDDTVRIAELVVVLDTMDSVPLREVPR